MNAPRQKLPIGIQSFAKLREGNCYYVDKTRLALDLITEGSHYFLSRPRRFGKSLFLDTLGELFSGNRGLFAGLYCEERWDWETRYPVIRISFGAGVLRDLRDLNRRILDLLRVNQQMLNVTCADHKDAAGCFAELIRQAHAQSGQRVVVLVDEYDKPILDNLTKPDIAREMRDGLRDFYSVIKDSDAHVKFVFLTGVSKFSKVSIFSGLNNLNDITLDADYSAICGYTDADLDRVFAPELKGLDRDQVRSWYNGYNWGGESVYNPFDLLLLFDKREFRPYWFETGTPTFLVDVLTQRGVFTPQLNSLRGNEALLGCFDVELMTSEALLWQTGYLTLRGKQYKGARIEYRLGYPNLEVESALNDALIKGLTGAPSEASQAVSRFYDTLESGDFSALKQHFSSLYASIPHDWYRNNPIAQFEGYYASVFYSHIAALGLEIHVEDATHQGRVDMTVVFDGQVWLFEFKVVEFTPEGKAIAQLKAKNYAEKYKSRREPIHLIGVEFSKETRSIVGFDVETLPAT